MRISGEPARIDIVILSYAADDELRQVTIDCLASLARSEVPEKVSFCVVVVESNRSLRPYQYPGTTTIYPDVPFGYNRYLNIGLDLGKSRLVCLANNDLDYQPGWATAILLAAEKHPAVLSFSPVDPWFHKHHGLETMSPVVLGYEKMKHVTGWCLIVRRELFQVVGKLDEKLEFWYVDDDYIKTLMKFGVRHAIVRDSRVYHKSGKTLQSEEITSSSRNRLTRLQWLYFDYKWNHRSHLLYFLKRVAFSLRLRLEGIRDRFSA